MERMLHDAQNLLYGSQIYGWKLMITTQIIPFLNLFAPKSKFSIHRNVFYYILKGIVEQRKTVKDKCMNIKFI